MKFKLGNAIICTGKESDAHLELAFLSTLT
jgi:hypothetical protein